MDKRSSNVTSGSDVDYDDDFIEEEDQPFAHFVIRKNSDGQEICTFRSLLCTAVGNKYSGEGCISLQGNFIIYHMILYADLMLVQYTRTP